MRGSAVAIPERECSVAVTQARQLAEIGERAHLQPSNGRATPLGGTAACTAIRAAAGTPDQPPAQGPSAGLPAQPASALESPEQAYTFGEPQNREQQPPGQPVSAAARPTTPLQPPRMRPTHFLSLRVPHHAPALAAIAAVQRALVAHSPGLQPCLLEPVTAHVTLCTMCLTDAERLQASPHIQLVGSRA